MGAVSDRIGFFMKRRFWNSGAKLTENGKEGIRVGPDVLQRRQRLGNKVLALMAIDPAWKDHWPRACELMAARSVIFMARANFCLHMRAIIDAACAATRQYGLRSGDALR